MGNTVIRGQPRTGFRKWVCRRAALHVRRLVTSKEVRPRSFWTWRGSSTRIVRLEPHYSIAGSGGSGVDWMIPPVQAPSSRYFVSRIIIIPPILCGGNELRERVCVQDGRVAWRETGWIKIGIGSPMFRGPIALQRRHLWSLVTGAFVYLFNERRPVCL